MVILIIIALGIVSHFFTINTYQIGFYLISLRLVDLIWFCYANQYDSEVSEKIFGVPVYMFSNLFNMLRFIDIVALCFLALVTIFVASVYYLQEFYS